MEPTLSLKLGELEAKLGTFAGWGRGANYGDPTWTSSQQAMITDCIQSGVRRFIYPEPLEGERNAYDWTFLTPTIRLTLDIGATTVSLPDDFQAFDGRISLASSGNFAQPWKIEWRNDG